MPRTKPFPWRCPECTKRDVVPAVLPYYEVEVKHDGRVHRLRLPEFRVPKCTSCGAMVFGNDTDEQIQAALHVHLKLLSPEEIRKWRDERLGLTQRQFANALGIAPETVSRWESGVLVQSRANDNLMRLFFDIPEVREALAGPDVHLQKPAFVEYEVDPATWMSFYAGFDQAHATLLDGGTWSECEIEVPVIQNPGKLAA